MSRRAAADGSESICCDDDFAPIRYHWFQEDPGDPSFLTSMRQLLAAEPDLTPLLIEGFIGDVRARLRMLGQGRLRPVDQVKGPMDNEKRFKMFEVRYRFEHGTTHIMVRAYHVEPRQLTRKRPAGSVVVGLHMHRKTDDAAQDEEIKAAGERYFRGHPSFWGVPPRRS